MVLAYRKRDYEVIRRVAAENSLSITELIKEAVKLVNDDPNVYVNSRNIDDYGSIRQIDVELSETDFMEICDKADFHNFSLEMYVLGVVKMYEWITIS